MNHIERFDSFGVVLESKDSASRRREVEKMVRTEVGEVYDHKAVPLFNYNKPVIFIILDHRAVEGGIHEFDIQSLMGDRLLLHYDGKEDVTIVNVDNNRSKKIPVQSVGKLTKWALDEYLKRIGTEDDVKKRTKKK